MAERVSVCVNPEAIPKFRRQEHPMIAVLCRGPVSKVQKQAYSEYLQDTSLSDFAHTAGNRVVCVFFFFQAEDGIRDLIVTGVQTCALPISTRLMASVVLRVNTSSSGRRAPMNAASVARDSSYRRVASSAIS